MAEPRTRYSTVAIVLHWVIAGLVLTQIGLIVAHELVEGPMSRTYVLWHKSIGLGILGLTLMRLAWRLRTPAPALPVAAPAWQNRLAWVTHLLFYVLLIGLPLAGWAASSAAGRTLDWFGLFVWPNLPVPLDRSLAGTFMDVHKAGVKLLYVLLALHVGAALKHHLIDRDDVLGRMLPFLSRRS
jgi:cytochrome b561